MLLILRTLLLVFVLLASHVSAQQNNPVTITKPRVFHPSNYSCSLVFDEIRGILNRLNQRGLGKHLEDYYFNRLMLLRQHQLICQEKGYSRKR